MIASLGVLKETGVKVTVLENDLDPVQVNQQMAQAVAQAPDLIMVEPADDKSLVAAVKKAKAAGVAVSIWTARPMRPSSTTSPIRSWPTIMRLENLPARTSSKR